VLGADLRQFNLFAPSCCCCCSFPLVVGPCPARTRTQHARVLSVARASSRRSFGSSSSTRRMTSFRTTLLCWFRTTSLMPRSEGELGDASLLLATLSHKQHGNHFCVVLLVGLRCLAGCSACSSIMLAGVVFSSTGSAHRHLPHRHHANVACWVLQ
jgi:hypothetical protein